MPQKSRQLPLRLMLCLVLLTACCAHAPYTERRQVMLVPQSLETSLGNQAYESIKRRYPLCQDPEINGMVLKVGQRLAAAAHRPDFRWEFAVFQDPKEANAFCFPGGKVGIFTGLLEYTQDETGLAVVMAHEAAHALARHAGERLSQSLLTQVGGIGLSLGLGGMGSGASQAILQAYGLGSEVGVLMPFSRTQEYEADRIGLILLARAGYDPAGALDFWQRMMHHPKNQVRLPQFLSTHPSDDKRIKAMSEFLPTAREYFHPFPGAENEKQEDGGK